MIVASGVETKVVPATDLYEDYGPNLGHAGDNEYAGLATPVSYDRKWCMRMS